MLTLDSAGGVVEACASKPCGQRLDSGRRRGGVCRNAQIVGSSGDASLRGFSGLILVQVGTREEMPVAEECSSQVGDTAGSSASGTAEASRGPILGSRQEQPFLPSPERA
jgi:hypothetical protein